jgi:50S ribosomal protein L16 3-hydroxylase
VELLGGLDPAEFLARYWQRRPLLIRGALPDFRDPLTADELAGLACEPEVESRLVMERGGVRPWQVIEGPQDARRLRRLPRTHWTLLVQEADRHVPALAELIERFTFVPRWRLDDVMVSFAPVHGGVGPHVDSYDVFLLQGGGRRRWSVDSRATAEYRPGLDLRVLKRFDPRRHWVLQPGDMLYLPPGLAHCGVSLEDAFTYSIGLRAPSEREITAAIGARLLGEARDELRYSDAAQGPPGEPGEIDAEAVRRLHVLAQLPALRLERRTPFARAMGEMLTEPKGLAPRPRARKLSAALVRARLEAGDALVRRPASRAAFIRRGRRAVDLFVDGRAYALPAALASLGVALTRARVVDPRRLRRSLRTPGCVELLAELVNAGAFELRRVAR